MLNVFICEDIAVHREQIKTMIEQYIVIENLDMKVALTTHDPDIIIQHLQRQNVTGLYFLDVNLTCEMNGIVLASRIREYDPRGFITFITAYPNSLPLTFKYKVEAMEFIAKDDFLNVRNIVEECIKNAYTKYTAKITELQRIFSFKLSDQIISLECSDIIYFETSTVTWHKIVIHLANKFYEYRAHLKDVEKELDKHFFKCHQSYIINLQHMRKFNRTEQIVLMSNGATCPVSDRYLSKLKKKLL